MLAITDRKHGVTGTAKLKASSIDLPVAIKDIKALQFQEMYCSNLILIVPERC